MLLSRMVSEDIKFSDEDLPKSFNLCDQELPPETDAHGEWIYLNGSSAALVEYQVCE